VLKPGGKIVSWEADLDLFIIDAQDYKTSRVMQRFICDSFHQGASDAFGLAPAIEYNRTA
jgi:hypothetical protein